MSSERLVCIVGPHRVQNELLADLITERAQIETLSFGSMGELCLPCNGNSASACLILKDAPPQDRDRLLNLLADHTMHLATGCSLAPLNVDPDQAIAREAFGLGVKGFFYKNDSPDTLVRGVKALFNGKLWISRRLMSTCLMSGGIQQRPPPPCQSVLTPREAEVLGCSPPACPTTPWPTSCASASTPSRPTSTASSAKSKWTTACKPRCGPRRICENRESPRGFLSPFPFPLSPFPFPLSHPPE